MIKQSSVREVNEKLTSGDCQIIDVREFSEFDGERVAGAQLMPLSRFDKHIGEIDRDKPVYVMCRSGNRAKQAAEKLHAGDFKNLFVIEGGMQAWNSAGLPTIKGESKVWSLERQVRFTAGSLVLIGAVLAFLISLYFILLSGFVGAGLVFAAVSDTCGMAMVLAKMPWNQDKSAANKLTGLKKA